MKRTYRHLCEIVHKYVNEYHQSKKELLWVWNELTTPQGKKWMKVFVTLFAVLLFLVVLQPLAFSWVIDGLAAQDAELVYFGIGSLALLVFLKQGVDYCTDLAREWLWNRNTLQIHDRLNELFYEKTLGQHSEEGSQLNNETIEKAKNKIDHLQYMILFETVKVVMSITLAFVLLWWISWHVGIVMTFLLIGHICWSLYLNYHVSLRTTPIEKAFRAENRQRVERWEKINRVKTTGKNPSEHTRLSDWFDDILHQDKAFWFWYAHRVMYRELVSNLVWLAILGYGSYLVYTGHKTIGFLVPLYQWVTQVIDNLDIFGRLQRNINQQIPYIKGMRESLTLTPDFSDEDGEKITHHHPIAVTFKDVNLHYGKDNEGEKVDALRNITFTISPGEKVALIGPSGAGKSSIMKLLLRHMDPTAGTIWVNGYRLRDVNLLSWMQHVGYIPQDPQIFDGTIRYNLTFGLSPDQQESITDEDIWNVMDLLRIDFGGRLINGLDTVVGKDGMKLSGGEKQRLIAGAAVIKQPIFMVIDEATSSLDSTTEKAVQRGLEKALSGPAGALIVAHRLSTVRTICDRFLVLRELSETSPDESQIEAEATSFEELYCISPTFRRLADDQDIVI